MARDWFEWARLTSREASNGSIQPCPGGWIDRLARLVFDGSSGTSSRSASLASKVGCGGPHPDEAGPSGLWVEWARRTSRKASHGCVGICQVRCRGSWLCVRSEWEHHGVAGALAGVWELGLFGLLWDGGGHRAPVSESADELVAAAGDIGRLAVGVEVIGWHWVAMPAPHERAYS